MRRPVKYILSIIIAVAILCSCGIVYSRASRVDAQRGILFDTTLFDNDLIKHYLAARESMPTYEDIRREDSLRRERERLEREVTIVCVGDMVLVRSGAMIPVDGTVILRVKTSPQT